MSCKDFLYKLVKLHVMMFLHLQFFTVYGFSCILHLTNYVSTVAFLQFYSKKIKIKIVIHLSRVNTRNQLNAFS